MIFERFEELVRHAQVNGATHMTMSNYHEGGFWKYGKVAVPKSTTDLEIEMLTHVLGDGWQDRLEVYAVSNFIDGPESNYRRWEMTEFRDTVGAIRLDKDFIPIEQAVDWYKTWNKDYD